MDAIIERLNSAGAAFLEFAVPMFVQSSVLILILLLVDFVLRKKVRAVFRYWIWLLVLAKLVLPSSLSSPMSLGYFFGAELAEIKITEAAVEEEPFDWRPRPAPRLELPEDIFATSAKADMETVLPSVESGAAAAESTNLRPESVTSVTVTWEGAVFLVWLVVVVAMGLLLLQRAMFVRGLVAQAHQPRPMMNDALKFCREQMGIKREVRLKVSANAASPAVCGLFRPVILVPANLGRKLGSRDLRAVLLHELAHIKRGDLWANLAQTVLQIAYFYNPLLWFANAMIRRVREQAVDEMVLVAMGRKAKSYPETLVNVAKLAFKQPTLSLRLIGVVESKNALAGRIRRILTRPLPKSAKLGILGLIVIIVAGCLLLPMAKQARKATAEVAGGPLAIQLVGVQPDGSDDLYDSNGKIKGKSFATKDARWSNDTQYRTFIFELPKPDDSILFRFPSLEVRPAGEKHRLTMGQSPLLDYSDGKLTYSVGSRLPRTHKGWFNKRLKKVDLTLRYYYGPRGHADFVFKGPFSPGQILKAEDSEDCQLTAIEDRLNFGNTPTAVLKVSSKTSFDKDSVLCYDSSGRRYLPTDTGGGSSSLGGSAYNYYVDGLTLDAIGYVTVGEKPYERIFKNVVVSYQGRPALDKPEFIDQMCTRLGLSGLPDQQFHQRKIENPADALKVIDIVRGGWYVRQVFDAIRYSQPKVDVSSLDAQAQQKIHAAAARWAQVREPRIRAMGISLGLFASRPEFLDLALKALEPKESLSDITGPPYGRLEQTAKSDVAWEVASYTGPIDDERVARIKRIVLEDRNPRTTEFLLHFLGNARIDAASKACWEVAQDPRPWIWWTAMQYLKRPPRANLQPFENLSEEMQKRLILVHAVGGDASHLFKVSSSHKDYETLAVEAYSMLPGLLNAELAMHSRVCYDVRQLMAKHLGREVAVNAMTQFLRGISQPQMQRVWARDNYFFGRCCALASHIALDFNRWYGVNIGNIGATYKPGLEPIHLADLKALIAETLKWYETSSEKAGETSSAGEAGSLLPGSRVSVPEAINSLQFAFAAVCEALNEGVFDTGDLGTWEGRQHFKVLEVLAGKGPNSGKEIPVSYRYFDHPGLRERPINKGEQVIWIMHSLNPPGYNGAKALAVTPENRAAIQLALEAEYEGWLTHVDNKKHFRFMYPEEWKVATGLRPVMHYRDVFVTLNSTGTDNLWVTNQEIAPGRWEYSDRTVAEQLPEGCVYMDIGWWEGPGPIDRFGPTVTEMQSNNLASILAQTPEKPTSDDRLSKRDLHFHKWGRRWNIVVYLREPVSADNRAMIEKVLRSFRFYGVPAGDEIWAMGEARKHLPPEAEPDLFIHEYGHDYRYADAESKGDEVYVTFTKADPEKEKEKKTWKFKITATGEVIPISAPTNVGAEVKKANKQLDAEIKAIFQNVDELQQWRKQRSREYLSSLSDEDLAQVYAKATAPQKPLPTGISVTDSYIRKIKQKRQSVIEELIELGALSDEDREAFRLEYGKLVDGLAALGPAAVPELAFYLRRPNRTQRRWMMVRQVLEKMGPIAVEPLIVLMDDQDNSLRCNVAYVLSQLADPRAKDVLLHGLDDESYNVRRYAINGLVRLGPEVVGQDILVARLTEGLQDGARLYESIRGLDMYGEETAIEALRVIERFHPSRGMKGDLRPLARAAINAILKRAGKPVKEVRREDYSQEPPSYEQLCAAAQCPNPAIRGAAINFMDRYHDDRTALFMLERMRKEKDFDVLSQIALSLNMVMIVSKDSSEPGVSAEVMQKAFDAYLPEAELIWTSQLVIGRGESGLVVEWSGDTGQLMGKIETATRLLTGVLHATNRRRMPLKNVDRLKTAVRKNLELEGFSSLKIVCYSAVTSIARLSPNTGESWSPQERQELQKQLAPLLDSPNPNIRLIECLGYVGDERLTPRLIELLRHHDSNIRRFAAYALGQIGDPKALPDLEHLAATDPYQYENGVFGVRRAASKAIEKIQKKQTGSFAGLPPMEFESSVDAVPERISEVFRKADELWEEMKQRSREYLSPMSDEELAEVYRKHSGRTFASALQEVKKRRAIVIGKLVEHGYYWSKEDRRFNSVYREQLLDGLAALGPKALPELVPYITRQSYMDGGKPTLVARALGKMGPEVVEPLLELADTQNEILGLNVFQVLMELADTRAKEVFLRNLDNDNGLIRERSLRGLAKLGPDIVGKEKLNSLLIGRLQDKACLGAAIGGLGRHGDESAIEPLRVVERSLRAKGEESRSSWATKAIDNIQRRLAGQDHSASGGHAVKGLKAVASCSVRTARAGEPILITCRLENVGTRPVTVFVPPPRWAPMEPTNPSLEDLSFLEVVQWPTHYGDVALKSEGVPFMGMRINSDPKIKVSSISKPPRYRPIAKHDFKRLAPGEEIVLWQRDALLYDWGDKPEIYSLRSPGVYQVRVRYTNSVTGGDLGLNAWTGTIRSNVVTVRVESPRSLDEIKPEISGLLNKLTGRENEHLKIRKNKLDAMSESEKRQFMSKNMALETGIETELRTLMEETATQLASYGEPSVPMLLEELRSLPSEFNYSRMCMARSLGQIGRPAVPYLIKALQGLVAREETAQAKYGNVIITTLGQTKDPRAVEPLLDLFHKSRTSSIHWSRSIATALALIGDKRAVEPLINQLDKSLTYAESNNEWDANSRDMLAYAGALGQLQDKRAIPVLKRTLKAGPQTTKAGKEYFLAEKAAQALRSLGLAVELGDADKANERSLPGSRMSVEQAVSSPQLARAIYVDADAVGANNGSSWVDAYRYLQDALAAARTGDEIRVAQGIYKPDQGKDQAPGDRQRTFRLGHVVVKGGYAGFGSIDPNKRDIARFQTILSGDLNGDDEPNFVNTDDNSSRVVTNLDGAILDGFTITGGNSDSSGAGMVCVTAHGTISNCIFRSNAAVSGGAMFISGVKPKRIGGKFVGLSVTLINCKFIENSAMRGGAIVINKSSPNLRDCVFVGNSAVALTSSSGIGGAIRSVFSDPNLTNCEFRENSAQRGGAIFNQQSNSILTDCTFVGNTVRGTRGPGIGSAIYNTYSNPKLIGCIFSKNSGDEAGPIHNSESSPTLTKCRFDEGSGVAEESSRAAPQPEGVDQQRDYEAARNVPQPIELWKVKKFGCGGNPRTMEKLQNDTKRHYPIVLTWPLIQNASKYVVQVKGVRGCRPTTSFESVTNSSRLEKADIAPGRYQWAVSVYDQDGIFMGDIEPIEPVEIFAIADPEPVEANGRKVLIDLNHCAGHIRGWGYYNHAQYVTKELLDNAGFEVKVNHRDLLTAESLKSFDLLICHYYWAGWPGFRPFLKSELEAIRQFVERGGSLLVVGCDRKDGGGKMCQAGNQLIKEFGLTFDVDGISEESRWAQVASDQNVISFAERIPMQLPVSVRGPGIDTLLKFGGVPIVRAKQFGRGKVIAAGVGMSFLDSYLGDFEHREPLHLIMFYDFLRYLTDIDWKKNCKQDFVETILSRCQFHSKAREFGGSELAWGQVVDGLQLGLSLDNKDRVYRQGDLVRLTAYLRNAGNAEQTVTYYLQHDDDYKAPPGQQTLRDSPYLTNSKAEPVPLRPRLRGANIVTDQELVLQPGQTRPLGKVRLAIAPLPEHRPAEYFAKLELGMYRISQKVNFRTRRTRGLATDVLQLHTGELELVVEPDSDVPWCEPLDGLRLRTWLDRTEFEIGEPIPMRFEFQNVSDRPLRICKDVTIDRCFNAVWTTSDGRTDTYPIEHYRENWDVKPAETVVIPPGRRHHTSWTMPPGLTRHFSPGPVSMKYWYDSPPNINKEVAEFFWSGLLRGQLAFNAVVPTPQSLQRRIDESLNDLRVLWKVLAAYKAEHKAWPDSLRFLRGTDNDMLRSCRVTHTTYGYNKKAGPGEPMVRSAIWVRDGKVERLEVDTAGNIQLRALPGKYWGDAIELWPGSSMKGPPVTGAQAEARRRNWPNPNPTDPPTDTRFKHFSPRELFPYVLGNKSINADGTIGPDDCRVPCAWFIWKTRNAEDAQKLRGELADRIVEKVREAQKDPSKSYHDCFIWAQFLGPLGAREQALLLLKESPRFACHPGPTLVEALATCGTIEDVPALIDAIDKESDGSGPVVNKALYKLTGVYMPLNERGYTDKAAWKKWWQQQQKTDVEDETARERVSQMVGAALPESVENVKVFSASFEEASVVLGRFDVPKEHLKVLLEESKRFPEFSGFVKTPELESRWAEHRYSEVDWWRPEELKEPAYGEWRASERALGGEGKVWVVQFVDIACGELANALMRVYLQNRSHAHTIQD